MTQIIDRARAGKKNATAPSVLMLSVYSGRECDADQHPLGTFPTQREAADAISEGNR